MVHPLSERNLPTSSSSHKFAFDSEIPILGVDSKDTLTKIQDAKIFHYNIICNSKRLEITNVSVRMGLTE